MSGDLRHCSEKMILDLVDQIYGAATNIELWPELLERLTDALGGALTVFLMHDLQRKDGSVALSVHCEPETVALYDGYYVHHDPWLQRARPLLRTGQIFTSPMLISDEELRRTEFYADYLERLGMFSNIAITLAQDDSMLACIGMFRRQGREHFSEPDVALMRALMPHLQRALQIHQRLGGLQKRLDVATEALDRSPLGVVVLDRQARVLLINRSAREMVDQRDGLALGANGLHVLHREQNAALGRLVREAIAAAQGKGFSSGGALPVNRPSQKRPFELLVAPFRSEESSLFASPPAALVFICDPEATASPPPILLRGLYGLTPTEANVAVLLAQGLSVAEIAESTRTSRNSVRFHVKNLLVKTGASRQSELVRLILGGLSGLHRP